MVGSAFEDFLESTLESFLSQDNKWHTLVHKEFRTDISTASVKWTSIVEKEYLKFTEFYCTRLIIKLEIFSKFMTFGYYVIIIQLLTTVYFIRKTINSSYVKFVKSMHDNWNTLKKLKI